MGIKLSADPTPQIQPAERLRAGFILALGGLVTVFKRVILPHLCLAAGLWLLTMFALYRALWTGGKAGIIAGVGSVLLAIVAVALAMGYAFLTSLFAALKTAATYAEDFFYELFEALKEKIRAQIDNMEEGIAKQQAKVMLDNSVREVLSPLKKLRVGSVPAAL